MARLYYVRCLKLVCGPEMPPGEYKDTLLPLANFEKMEGLGTVENGRVHYVFSVAGLEAINEEVEDDTTE